MERESLHAEWRGRAKELRIDFDRRKLTDLEDHAADPGEAVRFRRVLDDAAYAFGQGHFMHANKIKQKTAVVQ